MKRTYVIVFLCLPLLISSCEKFLGARPESSLALLRNLEDYQAIMDNETQYNGNYPFAGDYASDYYYLRNDNWNILEESTRNSYLWISEPPHANNWNQAYSGRVYPANVVLDGIDNADLGSLTEDDRKRIKGTAYFSRGFIFYHLAQIFAPPYEEKSAQSLLGISIRLTADINVKTIRSNLKETYEQILADLKAAVYLLPKLPEERNRPSKASAYAALSRVYLIMQDFEKSSLYADSCLMIYDYLIDYNDLDTSSVVSQFPMLNDEVIFHLTRANTSSPLSSSTANVDTLLYEKYTHNDLRRILFYRTNKNTGVRGFYGDYSGNLTSHVFAGIATDEIYLTGAESKVRTGDISGGLKLLNRLLIARHKTGNYTSFYTDEKKAALRKILEEREKELAFRSGIRWSDLRRLNLEPEFARTIFRKINDQVYTLEPNDKRYTFKIPYDVIEKTGIVQNE